MSNQKQQKPTLTGQRFKTRKRGEELQRTTCGSDSPDKFCEKCMNSDAACWFIHCLNVLEWLERLHMFKSQVMLWKYLLNYFHKANFLFFGHIFDRRNCLYSTDEKERFDPSQFQESIVQGLNQSGTDLEAVGKFLDASGAKLDYRRYAETLFDILVAGGMLGKWVALQRKTHLKLSAFLCGNVSAGMSHQAWTRHSLGSLNLQTKKKKSTNI